jgi:phosphoserine phosphatase
MWRKLKWWWDCAFYGRPYASTALASEDSVRVLDLYLRESLVKMLERESATRPIILATGAPHAIAQRVVDDLGFISHRLSSGQKVCAVGQCKLAKLRREVFNKPAVRETLSITGNDFVYIGDSADDIPVWKASKWPIVVQQQSNLTLIPQLVEDFPDLLILDYRDEGVDPI